MATRSIWGGDADSLILFQEEADEESQAKTATQVRFQSSLLHNKSQKRELGLLLGHERGSGTSSGRLVHVLSPESGQIL